MYIRTPWRTVISLIGVLEIWLAIFEFSRRWKLTGWISLRKMPAAAWPKLLKCRLARVLREKFIEIRVFQLLFFKLFAKWSNNLYDNYLLCTNMHWNVDLDFVDFSRCMPVGKCILCARIFRYFSVLFWKVLGKLPEQNRYYMSFSYDIDMSFCMFDKCVKFANWRLVFGL